MIKLKTIILTLATIFVPLQAATASVCFGTTSNGRIEDACKLPQSGENFKTYSTLLSMMGRTYVHCDVKKVLLEAFTSLASSHPSNVYLYGETGLKNGGKFKPHKTHQNGLSVDLMIPVINTNGESVFLPTHANNRYGYDIDFTLDGKYKKLTLDYDSLAAQLAAIKTAAKNNGIGIWRIIFDPKMQANLKTTKHWKEISDLTFTKKRSWVRHDDHIHIDFVIPCKSM